MKKVVIFGATGNIGAYLTDYFQCELGNKFEIIAVGRKKTSFFNKLDVRYINVDICKEETFINLPKEDVYAVVNCTGILPAYLTEYDPVAYINVNVTGAVRIIEYARKVGADRILYTQTWAVQGGYWGTETILSPKMPTKLIYTGDHAFYCITKNMVEETLKHYQAEYGIKSFVFRLPNVYLYNPEKTYYVDGKERVIAYRYMIDRASNGESIEMWGNPEAYKDVLYIKDLCQLMSKAIEADLPGGTYNAGTGIKTSLREQIEGIISVFSPKNNAASIIEKPDMNSFVSFVMDIRNAELELGYKPKYSYMEYLLDYKKEQELKRFDSLWSE